MASPPTSPARASLVRDALLVAVHSVADGNVTHEVDLQEAAAPFALAGAEHSAAVQYALSVGWLRPTEQAGCAVLTPKGVRRAERVLGEWRSGRRPALDPACGDVYPPYPERDAETLYLGSGWTVSGKGPGDAIHRGDRAVGPHFGIERPTGFVLVTGGGASGSRDRLLESLLGDVLAGPRTGVLLVDRDGRWLPRVLAAAERSGRQADLLVLGPVGETTYNPLSVSHRPVEAARLLTESWGRTLSEQPSDEHHAAVTEWLAHAMTLLRWVEGRTPTMLELADLAQHPTERIDRIVLSAGIRETLIARAAATEAAYLEVLAGPAHPLGCTRALVSAREARDVARRELASLGRAVDFFYALDVESADRSRAGAVHASVRAFASQFIDPHVQDFCCPPGDGSFPGFGPALAQGRIVVVAMNRAHYGPVADLLETVALDHAARTLRDAPTPVTCILPDGTVWPSPLLLELWLGGGTEGVSGFWGMESIEELPPRDRERARTAITLAPRGSGSAEAVARIYHRDWADEAALLELGEGEMLVAQPGRTPTRRVTRPR